MNKGLINIIDSTKITMINAGAIGVSLADVEAWLRIISLCAAIGYTFYKFYNEFKNDKN